MTSLSHAPRLDRRARHGHRFARGAAALAAALVLGACGNGDDSTESDGQATSAPDDAGETTEPTGEVPQEYAGVLAAIETAQEHAGGPAFEVDDGDGGLWEVHVAVGSDDIEVRVSPDGTEVLDSGREADLDSDDADGLESSNITLVDAIRIAIIEYGGEAALDDAGISDDGGDQSWEVAFTDDVEVYVDFEGVVIRTEDG